MADANADQVLWLSITSSNKLLPSSFLPPWPMWWILFLGRACLCRMPVKLSDCRNFCQKLIERSAYLFRLFLDFWRQANPSASVHWRCLTHVHAAFAPSMELTGGDKMKPNSLSKRRRALLCCQAVASHDGTRHRNRIWLCFQPFVVRMSLQYGNWIKEDEEASLARGTGRKDLNVRVLS